MIATRRVSRSLWSYNPLPTGCVLYLPLWAHRLSTALKSTDFYGYEFVRTGGTFDGSGFVLDGDDYLRYTVAAWQVLDNVGSVSGWVKTSDAGSQSIISSADETAATNMGNMAAVRATTGEIFINVYTSDNDGVKGSTAVNDGVFHCWTVSSNGSAWRIDVNGATDSLTLLVGANTGTWLNDLNSRDNLIVGAVNSNSAYSSYFNGTIGEIVVHNYQLSLAEHQWYYRMSYPRRFK